ncbi:MAG: response regulator [Planctomycetota bacterium]|jgi:DNA-binding NarL/FixJ family response regulator
MSNIRILLADDHKITREGLRSLLGKQQDMDVVAEAKDGRTAVRMTGELLPDVVIMDLTMPDLNGVQATKQIVSQSPDVKIIGLSMHSDSLFVTEMLKSGASGYLLKDCAFEELAQAIRAVVAGKTYLSPSISGVVVNDYLHRLQKVDLSDADILTDRELEVLQLIAEGNSTKQIALKLHISVKTVETHRRQIMNKLDIYTIAELTKYAIRKGLTSLDK